MSFALHLQHLPASLLLLVGVALFSRGGVGKGGGRGLGRGEGEGGGWEGGREREGVGKGGGGGRGLGRGRVGKGGGGGRGLGRGEGEGGDHHTLPNLHLSDFIILQLAVPLIKNEKIKTDHNKIMKEYNYKWLPTVYLVPRNMASLK